MNVEDIREHPLLVPHSEYGDTECCGIIMAFRNGEHVYRNRNPGTADVDLMCNECGAVLSTVPVADAQPTLLRLAMAEGVCSETCPHCGELNVFPGWSAMIAFHCRCSGSAETGEGAFSVSVDSALRHQDGSQRKKGHKEGPLLKM